MIDCRATNETLDGIEVRPCRGGPHTGEIPMRKFLVLVVLLMLVLTAVPAMASSHDTTQRIVVKASGEAIFDFANPSDCAAGFTTRTELTSHFQRLTAEAAHCYLPTGPDGGISDGGEGVFRSSNGVEIWVTYDVEITAQETIGRPIFATGTFTITGGTGQYENANRWRTDEGRDHVRGIRRSLLGQQRYVARDGDAGRLTADPVPHPPLAGALLLYLGCGRLRSIDLRRPDRCNAQSD